MNTLRVNGRRHFSCVVSALCLYCTDHHDVCISSSLFPLGTRNVTSSGGGKKLFLLKRRSTYLSSFFTSREEGNAQTFLLRVVVLKILLLFVVRTGLPSRGEDVVVYVFDIIQPSLPTSFYSVLVSVSVFMALSTIFHSGNQIRHSPDNSPLSHHSVLLVLFLPY